MRSTSATTCAFALFLALSCQSAPTDDAGSEALPAKETPAEASSESAKPDAPPKDAKKKGAKDDEDASDAEKAREEWDETLEDLEQVSGLFTLHHDQDTVLLELDEKSLGREFLYYGALDSGAGSGSIYRGAMLWETSFVLRFEKRGDDRIVLLAENARYLEPGDAREKRMLSEVTSEGILRSFELEAELEDEERYLIDLGKWFLSDNLGLADAAPGSGYSVDKDLSLFAGLSAFPRNVEIDQELVLSDGKEGNLTQADPGSLQLNVRHSLCAPPSDGYQPRVFDQRVGYFYDERKDLFDVDSVDPVERYINRWRLKKKDPSAEVSDPVQPIVFWIENSTPKRWRDAVRAGIEAWEPAFRAAGFSNAVVAKQMPEDAGWEPGDVRYSVVRWSADENVGFAIGPSRVDPRTGEIFDADITMQEAFVRIYGMRFDTLVEGGLGKSKKDLAPEGRAPVDLSELALRRCQIGGEERRIQAAQAMALAGALQPDFDREEFLQAMVREVVMHEVGHTLGLRHNFKSSTWRPVAELSDVSETASRGVVGSVMDYNPIILAAPGEEQGEFFTSVPGPYDMWAIEYGYKELGSNEKAALDAIASRSSEPGLEYGTDEDMFIGDALCQTWDMGKDPLDFSEKQIALAEAGLSKLRDEGADEGDGYHHYARWYALFSRHYQGAYRGLARFLGGWTFHRDLVGQDGGRPPIEPVDLDMQRRALDLMCDHGLRWTGGIPDSDRLLLANRKYGSFGSWFDFWELDQVTVEVNAARFRILRSLLNGDLYTRLGTQARLVDAPGLAPHDVADRVFATVWVDAPDEHDRWTQADFVDIVIGELGTDRTPDVTALFARQLDRAAERCEAYRTSGDIEVAAHGELLAERIRRYREREGVEVY